MKFAEHLNHEQKKKLEQMGKRNKPPSKQRKQDKVDWIDIMGINRDRYGRGRGGAMRRK